MQMHEGTGLSRGAGGSHIEEAESPEGPKYRNAEELSFESSSR